jgi:hypothetical protein
MLMGTPLFAQAQPSANPGGGQSPATSTQDKDDAAKDTPPALPVSIDKIKDALAEEPAKPLRGLNETPTFKVNVNERQKISLNDLIAAMDFKSGPVVAGGLYAYEQNRITNPAVDNPLRQPYAAFSQSELLTIVIENLAAKYLGGKALNAVSDAARSTAEQAARHEVQSAISEYCAAKPNGGSGIQLCENAPER